MAADVAMSDMDIDFSMDAEVDPEIARLQAEADAINARTEADSETMNGIEEAPEEGEVQATAEAPTKVHVRGLDRLSQNEVEEWAGEYYPLDLFKKVQWIDDTSANLIYDTEIAAAEALMALSAEEVIDPLQLRPANRFSKHPDMELQVRQAILADVKMPGAKDRSKFYLFNRAWDPDNPDNVRPDNRKRRRMDDDRRDRKYRRRDYRDDRYQRAESSEGGYFHESMYDDGPTDVNEFRRNSYSSAGGEYGRRKRNGDEDLFVSKDNGRLRNRSASPQRDGDGRYGFDKVEPRRRTPRARSPTPSDVRKGRENRAARDKLRKELFPGKRTSSALANGNGGSNNGNGNGSDPRELFPGKVNSVHRRQTAKDLTPNEVADAIGKYTIVDRADESYTYRTSGRRPDHSEHRDIGGGRDLFSRINGGPNIESTYGRLQDRPSVRNSEEGFSIKGAGGDGFSILGASRERVQNPLVKELFPRKVAGSEVFDGRIKGRGTQRNRAEDLI